MERLLPGGPGGGLGGLPVAPALALALMALEFAYGLLRGRNRYNAPEFAATLVIALGNRAIRAATAGLMAAPIAWAWNHRLAEWPMQSPWTWLALFLLVELVYYTHHVAMHRVRWFWASHAVHHSARHFNLSAALRLGWFAGLSGNALFYLPLALLGFHPLGIVTVLGIGLFYQFFLHTEHLPRLGPLEWIFNTPAHHRVHHASNEACLDRNFGSMLIVYDRLFGTFAEAPKDEALRYGVKDTAAASHHPLRIEFMGWVEIGRRLRRARTPGQAWNAAFGRP